MCYAGSAAQQTAAIKRLTAATCLCVQARCAGACILTDASFNCTHLDSNTLVHLGHVLCTERSAAEERLENPKPRNQMGLDLQPLTLTAHPETI